MGALDRASGKLPPLGTHDHHHACRDKAGKAKDNAHDTDRGAAGTDLHGTDDGADDRDRNAEAHGHNSRPAKPAIRAPEGIKGLSGASGEVYTAEG